MNTPFKLLALPSLDAIQEILSNFSFPVELSTGKLRSLFFSVIDNQITITFEGEDIKNFDFVWLTSNWDVRDLGYAAHTYLKHHGTPCTNAEIGTSKITDHVVFALNNLATPDTLHFNKYTIQDHLETIRETLGYPLVIKDSKGLGGVLSSLVYSEKELLDAVAQLPSHRDFIFQQFIPNDYDWGVMVANGTVVSGEKSFPAEGEFRNNARHGSKEVFVPVEEIPEEIKELAITSCKAMNLNWARADIIVDKETKKPYLLEVNRAPGVTSGSTEVTGAFNFLSAKIQELAL